MSGLTKGWGAVRPLPKQKFTYPAVLPGQGQSQHSRGKAQCNRYLTRGSGPGLSSPVRRVCCPDMVHLSAWEVQDRTCFIPRSSSRSARQTGTCKCQGLILFDLCLVWIRPPYLPPFHTLMHSPPRKEIKISLPAHPPFIPSHSTASGHMHQII